MPGASSEPKCSDVAAPVVIAAPAVIAMPAHYPGAASPKPARRRRVPPAAGGESSTTDAHAAHMTLGPGDRVRRLWQRLTVRFPWTRPTSTELGTVAKSGLAARLAWWLAAVISSSSSRVLAPLTAIVVVQVSVRASIRNAIERTATVVLGVLLALAIGNALNL